MAIKREKYEDMERQGCRLVEVNGGKGVIITKRERSELKVSDR